MCDKIVLMTSCEGRYPTIKELAKLITPELEGDLFKVIYSLYAMTVFFCPSCHDAVCPEYIHIAKSPDEIGSFDFSTAVTEKLAKSLEAFLSGSTSVLGGILLSLMVILKL